MNNVNMTVHNQVLTIVIDLSKSSGPSKSGNSIIIASTGGNVTVPGTDAKIGLNVYTPR